MKNQLTKSVLGFASELHFRNAISLINGSKLSSHEAEMCFCNSQLADISRASWNENQRPLIIFLKSLQKWKRLKKRNKTRLQVSFLTSHKRIIDVNIHESSDGTRPIWTVSYLFNTGECWKHEFFSMNEAFSCMGAYGIQKPRTPREQVREIFGGAQ